MLCIAWGFDSSLLPEAVLLSVTLPVLPVALA
jgi:hypothetical protein